MKIKARIEYGNGTELWYGVPTWDPSGRTGEMSVKFAYRTADKDRWARTSPEVPDWIVWDMLVMLHREGRLLPVLRSLGERVDALKGNLLDDIAGVVSTLEKVIPDTKIQSLGTKVRRSILQKKADVEGIVLPEEVLKFLADRMDFLYLEASVIRLGAYSSLMGKPITVELAKQALRDVIELQKKRT